MSQQFIDPITTEVIRHALQGIAEEMGVSLIRTAYSTNIKERRDCSCALFSAQGELVALAEHIPIHLGSMLGLMKTINEKFPLASLHPGDIIITNDPYRGGGSHLPDVTLVQPVFLKDRLVGFVANIAHWADIGGAFPGGGTGGASSEIFQEGLRIPPLFLYRQGKFQSEIAEAILTNLRQRREREGDLRAQLASLHLGERRLKELFQRHGRKLMATTLTSLFNYSEKILRQQVRSIPPGNYQFQDYLDDDGLSLKPLKIQVKIKVDHEDQPSLIFDFTGTDPQAEGGVNMVRVALEASVYYTVKALLAPNIPLNAGFLRPIKIIAPAGTLVNAQEPAAVGGRTDTCQRVVDTLLGAFSAALPQKVMAASNGATTALIFGGTRKLSGKDFVYVEALGGGMGARFARDGLDGIQVHITNTTNLPVEALEMEYPLRVLRYGLVQNSGGPGKYRGGLGLEKEIMALAPVLFSAHSDRHRFRPWGLKGGLPGQPGIFLLKAKNKKKRKIPSKINGFLLQPGDTLLAQTAGGGGYGSPQERPPEKVVQDYISGRISRSHAQQAYGVVLKTRAKKILAKATLQLRPTGSQPEEEEK